MFSLQRLYNYKKVYSNWISVLFQRAKHNEKIRVVLKDGSSAVLTLDRVRVLVDLIQLYNDIFDPSKSHAIGGGVYSS